MIKLNFQIVKHSDSAKWVVLLHGLFGSLSNLAATKKALQSDFNVISFDLPDHGESGYTDKFSFELYATTLFDQLSNLNIEKFSVVGHSLGGKVAMTLSFLYPDSVQKLIIADISPAAYSPRHQNVFAGLASVDLNKTKDRSHADKQLATHVEISGVRQFLLKSLYRKENEWAWRFNLSLLKRDYSDLSAALPTDKSFSGSTLFIKGAESDYLNAVHTELISKLFPNSHAKIIAGTGHWLHAEKPHVFNRIVNQFLMD